jgi:hypothetical protein
MTYPFKKRTFTTYSRYRRPNYATSDEESCSGGSSCESDNGVGGGGSGAGTGGGSGGGTGGGTGGGSGGGSGGGVPGGGRIDDQPWDNPKLYPSQLKPVPSVVITMQRDAEIGPRADVYNVNASGVTDYKRHLSHNQYIRVYAQPGNLRPVLGPSVCPTLQKVWDRSVNPDGVKLQIPYYIGGDASTPRIIPTFRLDFHTSTDIVQATNQTSSFPIGTIINVQIKTFDQFNNYAQVGSTHTFTTSRQPVTLNDWNTSLRVNLNEVDHLWDRANLTTPDPNCSYGMIVPLMFTMSFAWKNSLGVDIAQPTISRSKIGNNYANYTSKWETNNYWTDPTIPNNPTSKLTYRGCQDFYWSIVDCSTSMPRNWIFRFITQSTYPSIGLKLIDDANIERFPTETTEITTEVQGGPHPYGTQYGANYTNPPVTRYDPLPTGEMRFSTRFWYKTIGNFGQNQPDWWSGNYKTIFYAHYKFGCGLILHQNCYTRREASAPIPYPNDDTVVGLRLTNAWQPPDQINSVDRRESRTLPAKANIPYEKFNYWKSDWNNEGMSWVNSHPVWKDIQIPSSFTEPFIHIPTTSMFMVYLVEGVDNTTTPGTVTTNDLLNGLI